MVQSKKVRDFAEGVIGDNRTIVDQVEYLFNENAVINAVVEKDIGSDVMKDHLRNYLLAFPDIILTDADYFDTNNGIVMQLTCQATHLESFYGVSPTEKKIIFQPIGVFYFNEDEQVVKYDFQVDLLNMMEQLGMHLSATNKGPDLPTVQTKDMLMKQLKTLNTSCGVLEDNEIIGLLFAIKKRPMPFGVHKHLEAALLKLRCRTIKQVTELFRFLNVMHLFDELDKNISFTS